jgi:methionyl-tRNA formyltransferase
MTKDRILFFASGDFAIDTFESLLDNDFNIVGLVTSNDKVKYHDKRLSDIAEEFGVPTYTVKSGMPMDKDEFFIDWLKRADADIYCVISFKMLPMEIAKMAKKCSFNIHASLLPFLRGSSPINWAIRLGYKETGLTAFVLNNKIDCGDIIANTKVKISDGEKYTKLYKKLSETCVDFTKYVIEDCLQRDDWDKHLISQGSESDFEFLAKATKVNHEYFKDTLKQYTASEFKRIVDSVDDTGVECYIETWYTEEDRKERVRAKIYDVEVLEDNTKFKSEIWNTVSDGKTFIAVNCCGETTFLIKKIQVEGKKAMEIKDFLNGFRHFRDDNCISFITNE